MDTCVARTPIPARTLTWLLDPQNPSARYLTLTGIIGQREDTPAVRASRAAIPLARPARDILMAQYPKGYWMHQGIGCSPRYRATVWQILILAQLGVRRSAEMDRAVEHLFETNQRDDGAFRASKEPGDTPLALNASLLWALETMGYGEREQVRVAWSWALERSASLDLEKCPGRDAARAWTAVKLLWAANAVPQDRLDSRQVQLAHLAAQGLLASPPRPGASDPRWFELTFPLIETPDLLQWLEVLVGAGYDDHPALEFARQWLAEKGRSHATWPLERAPDKMWAGFGGVGEANKWVTVRALSVLA